MSPYLRLDLLAVSQSRNSSNGESNGKGCILRAYSHYWTLYNLGAR